jgi:ubiquinone/menaquinone biosynthesis C-methylase UbiE
MHSKLTDVEHTQLRIYQHSAEDLSVFNDGFFDGVNILLALFDMQNPKKALDEAIRVLKPTGIMVITEPKRTFDMNYLLREGQKFLERKGLYRSLASHWNCVMEVNRKIDPSTRNPLFIEDIENILNGQGIEVLRVVDSHFGQCSTLWAIKPNKPQQ